MNIQNVSIKNCFNSFVFNIQRDDIYTGNWKEFIIISFHRKHLRFSLYICWKISLIYFRIESLLAWMVVNDEVEFFCRLSEGIKNWLKRVWNQWGFVCPFSGIHSGIVTKVSGSCEMWRIHSLFRNTNVQYLRVADGFILCVFLFRLERALVLKLTDTKSLPTKIKVKINRKKLCN